MSYPKGIVFINQKEAGATPIGRKEVPGGRYEVVVKSGEAEQKKMVTVHENDTVDVAEEDLETALEVLYKLKNPSNTIIVYDASGSMRWPLSEQDGTPRFEPAQRAITDFVKKAIPTTYTGSWSSEADFPPAPYIQRKGKNRVVR